MHKAKLTVLAGDACFESLPHPTKRTKIAAARRLASCVLAQADDGERHCRVIERQTGLKGNAIFAEKIRKIDTNKGGSKDERDQSSATARIQRTSVFAVVKLTMLMHAFARENCQRDDSREQESRRCQHLQSQDSAARPASDQT